SVMEQSLSAYWDWVATTSFHLRQDRPSVTDIFYRQIVLSLLDQLVSGNPRRILKLDAYNEATNTQYGYYLMKNDRELVLVDISSGIAKKAYERAKAKKLYGRTHIVVGDFRRLPLRSGCVDMSCSFGSIEHVPEYDVAFCEQVRVVKEGGEVVVGVPNIANLWFRVVSTKILHVLGLMRKMTNPEKHFLRPQLIALAKSLGLSDIVFSGYHLFPKQLRWLDLWLDSRGRNPLRRSGLFFWLLKGFTLLELKYPFVRNFAEMILVRGVRVVGQDRGRRSIGDEAADKGLLKQST
ncbi:MAG: methyltransferase domain-containing protein, partial [Candidatus Caldarchaeum sp.]